MHGAPSVPSHPASHANEPQCSQGVAHNHGSDASISQASGNPVCAIPNADAAMIDNVTDDHTLDDDKTDFITKLNNFRAEHCKNLIVGHLNINSLRNKFTAVQDVLSRGLIDIFALCETKLDDSFPSSQFSVCNFKCYRNDRDSHGGGVMMYVRSDIPHYRRADIEGIIGKNGGVEVLIVECTIKTHEKWIIIAGYKPPSIPVTTFRHSFEILCDTVLRETENCIIMADFNVNFTLNSAFKRLCEELSLHNMIKHPTCDKGNTPTLIDVILVSKPKRFSGELNTTCWLSDHHNIICAATKLHLPPMPQRRIFYRSMRSFDESKYIQDLCQLRMPFLYDGCSVSSAVRTFSYELHDIISLHAPMKQKTLKRNQVVYMNSEWRKINHKRNMMRNIKDKYPSKENFEKYRQLRNLSTKIGKKSKRTYFQERCDSGPKNQHFWQTIKPFVSSKGDIRAPTTLLEEGTIISDTKLVCNVFNKYFTALADDIGFSDPIPDNFSDDAVLNDMCSKYDAHPSIRAIKSKMAHFSLHFSFTLVNDHTMYKVLHKLNAKKATGYDSIPSRFLKMGDAYLAPHLAHYVNMSILECDFPDVMKVAEVSPIFKKDNDLLKENFRPVSILTALSKIFERVYADQLTVYFEKIFSDLLSAFRQKYSCQSALIRMFENWRRALDDGQYVGALAMDLSKAFDSVPHGLLIAKFRAYGADITACKLLASYLHNRYQRVKIDDSRSDWCATTRGFPQGSILGPLLFNIYFNDIFYLNVIPDIYNYADDNITSVCNKSVAVIESTLTQGAEVMNQWFEQNSMQANPTKFQCTLLRPPSKPSTDFELLIGNTNIMSVSKMKVLGVSFDCHLSFQCHIDNVIKKATKQLYALMRLHGVLDLKSREAIYKSFISANFDYCPVAWMFINKGDILRLEKVQERALRFVYADFKSDTDVLFSKAKCTPIHISNMRKLAIEVYKCMYDINPRYMKSLFKLKCTNYSLRDQYLLAQPHVKTTTYGLRSVAYFGSKIWNALPSEFKNAASIEIFRSNISNWTGPQCQCSLCSSLCF